MVSQGQDRHPETQRDLVQGVSKVERSNSASPPDSTDLSPLRCPPRREDSGINLVSPATGAGSGAPEGEVRPHEPADASQDLTAPNPWRQNCSGIGVGSKRVDGAGWYAQTAG